MLAVVMALAVQAACPSALDLQRALNTAQVRPFAAHIQSLGSPQDEITPLGGFRIATPEASPGEIVWLFSPMAEFGAACGFRVAWTPVHTDRALSGASNFSVSSVPDPRPPTATLGDVVYRVSPEGEGSRLTVDKAGRQVAAYHVDFRATAVSMTPPLHTALIWLGLTGLQPDGSIVYVEFSALLPARP